jgi:hypothetical protein
MPPVRSATVGASPSHAQMNTLTVAHSNNHRIGSSKIMASDRNQGAGAAGQVPAAFAESRQDYIACSKGIAINTSPTTAIAKHSVRATGIPSV